MGKKIRSLRLSDRTWSQLERLAKLLNVDDRTKVVEVLTERESVKMAKKILVSKSWEELAAMDDNGMALYATPGAHQPYWASQPSFMYDECLAIPADFEWQGISYSREDECEEIFSVEIELLDPR